MAAVIASAVSAATEATVVVLPVSPVYQEILQAEAVDLKPPVEMEATMDLQGKEETLPIPVAVEAADTSEEVPDTTIVVVVVDRRLLLPALQEFYTLRGFAQETVV